MHEPLTSPPSSWYEQLKRNHIVRALETIQDLFIISLCVGLFAFMAIQLREMFLELLPPLDFQNVTSDILFLLILVELFRLLIIYLQEQRVSIGVAVEVSIVSVLREVIVRGVLETSWIQILAACSFLIVMAALLIVRVWLPPTFEGIDPEKRLAMRNKRLSTTHSSESPVTNLDSRVMASVFADSTSHLDPVSK
ncbi:MULTISPECIES: phosphate-starvation-inducible PsiE family protein [unclassified Coleofasciculus]|uniref:phosphate-starvation-inducible PsiE family protein n=1 Tax=unclassified Coleofasciculus TaxID=2692782 RepID=UPI00187EEA37|nr:MULTISPECIES: phosphate-starvation-inducible PsiE family protein [unclassified Coleofasciculus]MBE9130066.1 phosphate-starvation-inducible PsiE family protein [Coleofasciculus sp. LEGE 07081]MBE9152318.1 phosphate-starvation-inducible PsiE family protein [Coleofasciculus sp. LEGE 07092]